MTTAKPVISLNIKDKFKIESNGKFVSVGKSYCSFDCGNGTHVADEIKLKTTIPSYYRSLIYDLLRDSKFSRNIAFSYVYMSKNKDKDGGNDNDAICYCYYDTICADNSDIQYPITPSNFLELNKEEHPYKQITKVIEAVFTEEKVKIAKIKAEAEGKKATAKRAMAEAKEAKADAYAKELDAEKKEVENRIIKCLETSGHVVCKCSFLSIGESKIDNTTYTFKTNVCYKFYRYPWGEYLKVLPVPRLPMPGEPPKNALLIGLDDAMIIKDDVIIRENETEEKLLDRLRNVNAILRGGRQVIFIRGEPGSGKDVFSTAIHFGSVRPKFGKDGFKARSVAGMTSKELRKLLFGYVVDGTVLPGLIERAEGGTLFLDEFDKIREREFYPELLRVLEAKEYVPVDGANVKKINDLNWIFAGAFTGTGLSLSTAALPSDFWSRMTSQISIENPIKIMFKDTEINSYAGALFLYFFMLEAAQFAGGINNLIEEGEDFRVHVARTILGWKSGSKEYLKMFGPGENLIKLASEFEQAIGYGKYGVIKVGKEGKERTCWHPITTISANNCVSHDSVRGIIQAAKAAFTALKSSAMEGCKKDVTIKEIYEQKMTKRSINRASNAIEAMRPGNRA
jgi:hypothetical protein